MLASSLKTTAAPVLLVWHQQQLLLSLLAASTAAIADWLKSMTVTATAAVLPRVVYEVSTATAGQSAVKSQQAWMSQQMSGATAAAIAAAAQEGGTSNPTAVG
jgi:hypothetical protein